MISVQVPKLSSPSKAESGLLGWYVPPSVGEQGGPVFGAEYDVITPRLAAKDGDLEHQESYLSVTASTKALDKEVEADLN